MITDPLKAPGIPRRDRIPYDIREIREYIVEWCDEVYPERTVEQMTSKLLEEFKELAERPLDAWEFADVFIILLDLADELGFDLAKLAYHKMAINRRRSWKIDHTGVLQHVEPTGSVES